LHDFGAAPDGAEPFFDALAPLGLYVYGATLGGGPAGYGILYKVDVNNGTEKILYKFTGGNDGCYPESHLVLVGRLFYGTTTACGAGSHGTIFSLDPVTRKFTTLYSFAFGTDGGYPVGALVSTGGYLWGVNSYGGANFAGTLFKFDPATGTETALYSFGAGTDGSGPQNGLTLVDGKLYGTTQDGGTYNVGTAFSYDIATGTEKVLYNFGPNSFTAPDAYYPTCQLLFVDGALYGTTTEGGAYRSGTIFKIDPVTGAEKVLYSFKGGISGPDPADGGYPPDGLTIMQKDRSQGQLYGMTDYGGPTTFGTIFTYNIHTKKYAQVYNFTGGQDGGAPFSLLTPYGGLLYGTTSAGGPNGGGAVFSYKP
jgi:uncharacterized repeat protein (TIGR03803 family)